MLVVEEDDEGVEKEMAKVDGGWWRRRATIFCDGVWMEKKREDRRSRQFE